MINLLPPFRKGELLQEGNYKIILTLGLLSGLFLISLSLILFAIQIRIVSEVFNQRVIADAAEQQFQKSESQRVERDLKAVNKIVADLNGFYQRQPDFTEFLDEISKVLPAGVYLTDFSMNLSDKAPYRFQIALTGFAPTRELLRQFKINLESHAEFEDIYFPLTNWFQPVDISFTLNFKMR